MERWKVFGKCRCCGKVEEHGVSSKQRSHISFVDYVRRHMSGCTFIQDCSGCLKLTVFDIESLESFDIESTVLESEED